MTTKTNRTSATKIEELDFSNALPNKFAGREIVIVGDRKKKRAANGSGKLFLVTLPAREDVIEIEAESREDARREVLRRFNKKRLPRGTRIEVAA
jgi:hypothetical protein